jgi:aspartyl-tRNA(Asn)/glutamyl-tRNA(Gln) amidotransferase subunit A
MLDLSTLTLADAARGLRSDRYTSGDLTEAALARIEGENARLNAFITVTRDLARAQAAAADHALALGEDRGALHGIPISLKDLFDVEGLATTAASRVRDGHVASSDAPVIRRLRHAGAVFVGKTNLHEFALGTTSEDSAFGPVRHPRDPSRSPGGSSGGSAASVVAGMALATVGTDTGGSIRIPSAACGLVGFKPPFGAVPCDGVVPLSQTLDHVGPLAKTVEDARLLYLALSGEAASLSSAPAIELADVRAASLDGYFVARLQPAVRDSFDSALARLRDAGLQISTASIAHAADVPAIYVTICLAEAAALHARTLEDVPERYTKPVRHRLELGRYIPAEDYLRAQAGRNVLRSEVDEALRRHDVLLLPTMAIVAPPLGASTVEMDGEEPVRSAMLRLTQPFNLSGHPAITLPVAASPEGLPVGLQLVGRETDRLLDIARAVEGILCATAGMTPGRTAF